MFVLGENKHRNMGGDEINCIFGHWSIIYCLACNHKIKSVHDNIAPKNFFLNPLCHIVVSWYQCNDIWALLWLERKYVEKGALVVVRMIAVVLGEWSLVHWLWSVEWTTGPQCVTRHLPANIMLWLSPPPSWQQFCCLHWVSSVTQVMKEPSLTFVSKNVIEILVLLFQFTFYK